MASSDGKPGDPTNSPQGSPVVKKEYYGVGMVEPPETAVKEGPAPEPAALKHEALLKSIPRPEDLVSKTYSGAFVRRIVETIRSALEHA